MKFSVVCPPFVTPFAFIDHCGSWFCWLIFFSSQGEAFTVSSAKENIFVSVHCEMLGLVACCPVEKTPSFPLFVRCEMPDVKFCVTLFIDRIWQLYIVIIVQSYCNLKKMSHQALCFQQKIGNLYANVYVWAPEVVANRCDNSCIVGH